MKINGKESDIQLTDKDHQRCRYSAEEMEERGHEILGEKIINPGNRLRIYMKSNYENSSRSRKD